MRPFASRFVTRACALTVVLAPLAGCVSPDPVAEPEPASTGTVAQGINGPSSDANAFERVRAVAGPLNSDGSGPGCTATKIAPNFVISAAHCGYAANETVTFYGTSPVGSSLPVLQTAKIVNVVMKPGVDGSLSYNSKTDSNGNWADFALLQIDRADTFGEAATLAWKYPGANVNGTKVGCGHHNDNPNPDGILLQVSDTTWSASAGAGSFWTTLVLVDHGDSGGPFYVNNQVLGTASYFVSGSGTRYTSMPFHLDFILSKIGYRWSGNQPVSYYYGGTMIDSFWSTERVCQYACDARSDCQAYDFALASSQCQLVTNISSVSFQSGFHGALHYAGARSSRTGAVVGYVRSDNTDSIVRVATDAHVHEFFYSDAAGRWNVGDVTANATLGKNGMAPPAPSSGALLTAYSRADGNNSILYRSGSSLVELTLTGSQWTWFFFPTLAGAPPAGDPAAYIRGDGLSAVLYRATNNHIIEITETLQPAFWTANDLTAQIAGAPLAASDPTAYVRSDGISSVVFRATDSQIYELFMSPEHVWDWGEPSVLARAPAALGRPSGYVQHDGTNSILYRNTSSRIEDLWLDGAGWHGADTTGTGAPTISDPIPYLRTDAVEAVLYVGWNYAIGGQLWEIANQGSWQANNLSALFSTGNITTNAQPFVAHDGWDTVPFGFASGSQVHIGDLEHQPGSSWSKMDLTLWTGETP